MNRVVALCLLLVRCGTAPVPLETALLHGPWFTDGPSFELVIREQTILFEFDMMEHPYRLENGVLVIEFDDGVQRKRILRLTRDEMEWRDEAFGTVSVFHRKGAWDR